MALSKTGVTLALIAFLSCAVAQDKPEKKPKDQAEYDLITSIDKQPTPAERLARLEKWSKDYPASDFADVRLKAYLITYQQMNRTKDAFSTATEMLKGDPNDVLALTTILSYIYAFNPPSAQDLDTEIRALLRRKRPRRPEQLREGRPLREFHGDEVDALLDAELVDRHDIGVTELDRGFRFCDETS